MQLTRYISTSFCILFVLLSSAQDTSKYLQTIPVFAKQDSILRLAVISASIPHFELTAAKLDQLGAKDVGEALKYIPGVQLRDYGGIGGVKTLSFRSLGAGHTAVQLDGIQIPNLQTGVINLSSFELFGLEKISFSSGRAVDSRSSASAYIPANTIALNSILASQPHKFRLGLYSNSTSINAYEKGLFAQTRLGKRFFIGGQGMVKFGNGQYKFIHPESSADIINTRLNTALFNYRARIVGGFIGRKNKITISAFLNKNEQELPGAAVLFNPSNDQKLWNQDWRLNLIHELRIGKWNLQSHFNLQDNFTNYQDPYYLNLDGFINVVYYQENLDVGTLLSKSFRFPNERVFIGTDLVKSSLFGSNITGRPIRLQNNSVIGGSTMFGKFKLDGNVTAQFIQDTYESTTSEDREFLKFSPFVAMGFRPFSKTELRFRAFYKNTFRMPTFNDLYFNFIGNTGLEPEDANLFNLGITYGHEQKDWSAELTIDGYYNRVKNKIVAIPTKDLFNWSMQNIGETDIRGIDIGALVVFKIKQSQLTLNSNHSFNSSIDITNILSPTYGSQIPYTPYYSSTSGVSWEVKGFSFSSNVLISGYRFSLNENIYANLLPGFVDINLGISKKIHFEKSSFLVDLKLMNLLNKNYQVIRSFPMPGRYLQLRLKYSLAK
ncbi:MAG: TonB-dependent receptor [Crocinitomix sp.]|nr:TonB-dependent receptor [Crocinitomix sp.]